MIATHLPIDVFRPLALVLLMVVGLTTLLRPALGEDQALRWQGGEDHGRHRVAAITMGAVIGGYDGLFGPGTGTFLVFGLVSLLGYSFLNASAIAKVVNVSTNVAALLVFAAFAGVACGLGVRRSALRRGVRRAVRRAETAVAAAPTKLPMYTSSQFLRTCPRVTLRLA